MNKDEFKKALTDRFEETKCLYEAQGTDDEWWAWDFLSGDVFDFTLYDSGMDKEFSMIMLEVIKCVLNRETFEYQNKSAANYKNYLTMVNMPFLAGKLNWGGSIRGAWFDDYMSKPFDVCCGEIEVDPKDINVFMSAVVEWADENCKK